MMNDQPLKEDDEVEDVEATKLKAMEFWDQIDEVIQKMTEIEDEYKGKVDLEPHGHFCDDHLILNILKKRQKKGFFDRASILKKRISFYGIFNTSEQHMLLQEQFNYMKAKSIKLMELFMAQQNKLVRYANKHKSEVQPEIEPFQFFKNQDRFKMNLQRRVYLDQEHREGHEKARNTWLREK